jgi:hypothetical protein
MPTFSSSVEMNVCVRATLQTILTEELRRRYLDIVKGAANGGGSTVSVNRSIQRTSRSTMSRDSYSRVYTAEENIVEL